MGLEDMLAALERYMFMGAGDWAAALVQELSDASLLLELPGPHDMPRILDSAILVRASFSSPPPCMQAWHAISCWLVESCMLSMGHLKHGRTRC